jgi:UPF0755 protein
LAVALLVVLAAAWRVARDARPANGRSRRAILVDVPAGLGVGGVARLLARRGLLPSVAYFEALSVLTGESRRLEAGVYRLSPAMTPAAILERIARGDVATVTVTVVPGMTVAEVAHVVARAGLVAAPVFLRYAAAARPPAGFAGGPGVREPLEGYLYPDTYRIALGSSAAEVVAPMLAAFVRAFDPAERARARAEGLSPAAAVTLASIVQREAASPTVRRKVAAVFLNRLHAGMPLGSDATVYYAADVGPGQSLTAQDLASPSPYNTLDHDGLPPGPIDSPGGGALTAVLHPAHVPYLYFFARPDGRYVFSRTYAGQLAAEGGGGG